MNLDDVRSKVEVIEANRVQIRRLQALGGEAFASDPVYLDSGLHRLQTSVQALIDIAAYVLAGLGSPAPRTSGDLIRALAAGGHIAAADAERYLRMIAFRNRIVHLYNRIDAGLVHGILVDHAGDLDAFLETLLRIIAARPDQSSR